MSDTAPPRDENGGVDDLRHRDQEALVIRAEQALLVATMSHPGPAPIKPQVGIAQECDGRTALAPRGRAGPAARFWRRGERQVRRASALFLITGRVHADSGRTSASALALALGTATSLAQMIFPRMAHCPRVMQQNKREKNGH